MPGCTGCTLFTAGCRAGCRAGCTGCSKGGPCKSKPCDQTCTGAPCRLAQVLAPKSIVEVLPHSLKMLLGTRHRGKQPQKVAMAARGSPISPISAGVIAASRAEDLAADGLLGLRLDSRVCNVHFTHSRTKNPKDVQPDQITRKQFWEHLCRCFREAFPRADSVLRPISVDLILFLWKQPRPEYRSRNLFFPTTTTPSPSMQSWAWYRFAKCLPYFCSESSSAMPCAPDFA